MVKMKKILSLFLLITMVAGIFAGCAEKDKSTGAVKTVDDLEHATLGIVTGTSWDLIAQKNYPNAERKYFGSEADALLALGQGKIDALLVDKTVYTGVRWENSAISCIDESLGQVSNALIFAKEGYDENLLAQINAFIAKAKENGTLERLSAKWFADTEPVEHPDYTRLSGQNGTLRIAVCEGQRPVTYQKGTMYTGYEVDFLALFAEEYGYQLDFQGMSFDALIPSVATGKCDIGACGITITPERAENVTFSDPHFETYGVAVVRAEATNSFKEMTLDDLETATIGVITGSAHNGLVDKNFPEAKKINFNLMADMLLAVQQGKIDCYIEDAPFMAPLLWEGIDVKSVDEAVAQVSSGFVFPQREESSELRRQVNAFLAEAKADGTINRLIEKWLGDTEPTEHPAYSRLTGENGTIHLAISVDNKPLLYQTAEGYTGFEMELLTLFGQYAGYAYDIEVVPFESIIAGISSGKYDMAASALNITPEREESVDFSDPYASFDVVMVVAGTPVDEGQSNIPLADFNNAKIGIHTGSIYDTYAKEHFPNADLMYYNLLSDMMVALDQGKIDGFISETTYITGAIWEGAKIKSVEEPIAYTNAAYVFQKGESSAPLREQLNAFIRKSKENGTIDKLREKWLGETEPTEALDYQPLTGENGTIRVAVAPDVKPITYMKDGEPTGYEIELLTMFAKEYGYKLDISYMSFDAVLPGVTTGKYDIGTGAITITEERAESLDFSESHLTDDVIMVVKAEDDTLAAQNNFWSDVRESFEKTFIREDRWKLIIEGIGVTMLISICATIAGSLLGFGLYMLSRSDVKLLQLLAKGVAKVYSRIIAGTPVVVILMILFYVVFGKIRDMSGIVVAIIGFTLTFGAFVYDHMTVSVGSVDWGQTEAAYALGYTKNQTFFRIIFPQAMTVFLPSYCGQAVELIKATAVVGYVAVNDLTKMGDIIRSNTYEAFFPLIATAIIYFLLTWILSLLLGLVKKRFEPKRRKKEDILKGVKTV